MSFGQEEEKKQLKAELTVMETKARRRSLGNIRFIGELFQLQVCKVGLRGEVGP